MLAFANEGNRILDLPDTNVKYLWGWRCSNARNQPDLCSRYLGTGNVTSFKNPFCNYPKNNVMIGAHVIAAYLLLCGKFYESLYIH